MRLLGLGDLRAPEEGSDEGLPAAAPLSRVAEDRAPFAGAEEPVAGERRKPARRRRGWQRPGVTRMEPGKAEQGRGEPAAMAS